VQILELPQGIHAIKERDGYDEKQHEPHLRRLSQKRHNALIEYMQISLDLHGDIQGDHEEALTERNHAPNHRNEQLQVAPRNHPKSRT
jgi:hypothetical protein